MYRIRILNAATHELARLDKPIGRRIVERLNWLGANFDTMTPEALTGKLSGFYKFGMGDYRILDRILQSEQILVIHAIGHRREVKPAHRAVP